MDQYGNTNPVNPKGNLDVALHNVAHHNRWEWPSGKATDRGTGSKGLHAWPMGHSQLGPLPGSWPISGQQVWKLRRVTPLRQSSVEPAFRLGLPNPGCHHRLFLQRADYLATDDPVEDIRTTGPDLHKVLGHSCRSLFRFVGHGDEIPDTGQLHCV